VPRANEHFGSDTFMLSNLSGFAQHSPLSTRLTRSGA
jgi:hypothetical protein